MIKASIYKPITMIMVILTVVVFGLYTYSMMVVDLMPKFDVPVVTATIIYQVQELGNREHGTRIEPTADVVAADVVEERFGRYGKEDVLQLFKVANAGNFFQRIWVAENEIAKSKEIGRAHV